MWVRGLKYLIRHCRGWGYVSHPMWVRGLKYVHPCQCRHLMIVAPHVGAWIEIGFVLTVQGADVSRTPCGCVD